MGKRHYLCNLIHKSPITGHYVYLPTCQHCPLLVSTQSTMPYERTAHSSLLHSAISRIGSPTTIHIERPSWCDTRLFAFHFTLTAGNLVCHSSLLSTYQPNYLHRDPGYTMNDRMPLLLLLIRFTFITGQAQTDRHCVQQVPPLLWWRHYCVDSSTTPDQFQ